MVTINGKLGGQGPLSMVTINGKLGGQGPLSMVTINGKLGGQGTCKADRRLSTSYRAVRECQRSWKISSSRLTMLVTSVYLS